MPGMKIDSSERRRGHRAPAEGKVGRRSRGAVHRGGGAPAEGEVGDAPAEPPLSLGSCHACSSWCDPAGGAPSPPVYRGSGIGGSPLRTPALVSNLPAVNIGLDTKTLKEPLEQ